MRRWPSGWPGRRVYAAVFIDAIHVKVRDGQVDNRPIYAAIGVDLAGHKDVLGLWAGNGGGETAKFWMSVVAELKNRGVVDVFFVARDAAVGLPDSVEAVFPQAVAQTCVIHLISEHLPVCLEEVLGTDRRGSQAPLRSANPGRGLGSV